MFDVAVTGERGFAQTYARLGAGAGRGDRTGRRRRWRLWRRWKSSRRRRPAGWIVRRLGRLTGSFHVGSAHPVGRQDDPLDSNVHFRIDASYPFGDRYRLMLMAGDLAAHLRDRDQRESSSVDRPLRQSPALLPDDQRLEVVHAGRSRRLLAGNQLNETGYNLGFGAQIPLASGPFDLELGADYHLVQTDEDFEFVTVQLGVLFR